MKKLFCMVFLILTGNALACDAIVGDYLKCGPGAELSISTKIIDGKKVLTISDKYGSQSLTEGMNVLNDADTELVCTDAGAIVKMYAGSQAVASLSYTVNDDGVTVYNNEFMGQSTPEVECVRK